MKTGLSAIEKKTITLNTLFNFSGVLVSLFVSVYLYVYTKSIPVMCLRTVFWMSVIPLGYSLAYKVSLRHSIGFTYTVGLVLYTVALVFILLAGELLARYPALIMLQAMVYGMGDAFYWYSANTCNQTVPTGESRNAFLSCNGLLCNIAGLAAPFFSTVVLSVSDSELAGYRVILACIVAIFMIVSLIAFSIRKHTEDTEDRLKDTFRLCVEDQRLKRLCLSYLSYGLVNGLALCLLGLMIYRAVGSGNTYSRVQILFSLIAVAGFYLIRYLFAWGRLKVTFRIGTILRVLSIVILVVFPNLAGAIVHGILITVSNVFFDNSIAFIIGFVLDDYPGQKSALIVAREIMLAFGRIGSMLVVLAFYLLLPGEMYLTVAPVLLSLAAVLTERILIKCWK